MDMHDVAVLQAVPIIFGDGDTVNPHDDSAGLTALVCGRPVDNRAGVTFDGERVHVPVGVKLTTRGAIYMRGGKKVVIP